MLDIYFDHEDDEYTLEGHIRVGNKAYLVHDLILSFQKLLGLHLLVRRSQISTSEYKTKKITFA